MGEKKKLVCYHCGLEMHESEAVWFDGKPFCCNGCKTVYEILNRHDLSQYYTLNETPGVRVDEITPPGDDKYAYLDKPEIRAKLLEFDDGQTQVVNFYIPSIHCSSCIWVLEHLEKLNPGVLHSEVNFPAKTARITYDATRISLRQLVELLASIAYEPLISLDSIEEKKKKSRNRLITQIGVAGFAFGNIMIYTLPEYIGSGEYWLQRFAPLFRWLSLGLSVPVVLYSARDYFDSAIKSLRKGIANTDILIALGITVLFLRSAYEVISGTGQGYFDSLTGLVFFLLIGKYFQRITYDYLSFERDYKSYFPIATVKVLPGGAEEIIEIKDIRPGDRLLIRNNEIIPVDGVVMKNTALVDYSFVTGESVPVEKPVGEKVLAGGKQTGNWIEIEAVADVDNSYLTRLWSREIFKHPEHRHLKNITDRVSRWFTLIVLGIATAAGLFWWWKAGAGTAVWIVSAVLIVACPCALSLAGPFAFGNILRKFGLHGLYLKNDTVVEDMAAIDTLVFDKTGTLTRQEKFRVHYEGRTLTTAERQIIKSMAKMSNHPLSRLIYRYLQNEAITELDHVQEITGKGILALKDGLTYKLGAAAWTGAKGPGGQTSVWFYNGREVKGVFRFEGDYREGLPELFARLRRAGYNLYILSGDNDAERPVLERLLPEGTQMRFNRSVHDKTDFVAGLQAEGHRVMMLGDGLNDAGALRQSDVGIAVAEDTNVFTPSSDGILSAARLPQLDRFLRISRQTRRVIYSAFVIAFFYNVIGLGIATANLLTPVIAAILMPVSSISVVVYVTLWTNWLSRRLG